ncbi:MAG: hypothetical protein WDN27_06255 [Candidatus Saccharibacteria bacterium]
MTLAGVPLATTARLWWVKVQPAPMVNASTTMRAPPMIRCLRLGGHESLYHLGFRRRFMFDDRLAIG